MQVLINTDDVPAGERFGLFRDAFLHELTPAEVRCDRPTGFSGRVASADLGLVTLLTMSTRNAGPGELVRDPKLIRRSDPEGYRLTFNQRGSSVLTHNGHRSTLLPGDFTLIDTSRPYEWSASGTNDSLVVRFPRELLRLPGAAVHRLIGAPLCGRTGIGALLSAAITRATRDFDGYRPGDVLRASTTLLNLLGGVLAHELDTHTALPPESHREVLFQRIQRFIQHRLDDPTLSPKTIAAAHHIAPRTLHLLFQDHDDTVAGYIRGRRLEHCRRDLGDFTLRERPIHAIAARWGFTSAAHFSRTFRTAYGLTPQAYRQHSLGRPMR
ncbi:helix-turn-helix domain-containing protein [Actinomadura alba]|uniref:Helix-turn-helix domain-containing protein n=1 Tax=Actinomadura alba TaxID=406431 RepID=A0ABR7LUN1_9ACTN|nr:helix-turn-helix domain-containing protein [Actinomadura alba]MBC6468557.1 helix-turn-helix domain-containing protein [Actinomadura alba]